jgi:hypothetical protein
VRNSLAMGLTGALNGAAAKPLSRTHQMTIGALFLVLCGWKFTAGLSRVLDLDVSWHEARYLALVTHHDPGPVPPEYSPLYVAFYQLEQLFAHDPVKLYYLHASLVAVLLPVAFFCYLMARSVPFALALPCSAYLMISAADLPVAPKPVHLGLAVIFVALAVFVSLREGVLRWTLILAASGVLCSVRPEFLTSFAAIALYAVYRAVSGERADRRIAVAIPLAAAALAPVWWALGLPLFNARSMEAFARHFALNYVAWMHLGEDPVTADYLAIFRSVFGDAGSIPAAFLANPGAFLHHLALNLYHAPKVVIEIFLAHYNVLLPRFQLYAAVEALLLGVAVLTALAIAWSRHQGRLRMEPRPATGLAVATRAGIRELLRDSPDIVCLLCFLIPFPLMVTVLYPRLHYALGLGLIPLALLIAAFGPRLPLPPLRPRLLLLLPLLFALIPSLGSAGASFTFTKLEVESRPNWNTVEFLRQFHPAAPVNILEAAWLEPYLDLNFKGVAQEEKNSAFLRFIADREIGVVVSNDRMRNDRRFSLDPQWKQFEATPERFGFKALPVEESDIIVYVKDDVLKSQR